MSQYRKPKSLLSQYATYLPYALFPFIFLVMIEVNQLPDHIAILMA